MHSETSPSRLLAIGDIHGCSRALAALLAAVAPTPDDLIVTLGDYVDRGLDSAGVIDRLIALSDTHRLVPVRGNHEEFMLDARCSPDHLAYWMRVGGDAALISYAPDKDDPTLDDVPDAHWHFLEHACRDFYETEDHFFVHGGVVYDLPLDLQPTHILRWQPFPPRQPHCSGKRMICGHTPQRSGTPAVLPHAVCIDTAAGFDGYVTCLDALSNHYWQANEDGHVRDAALPAPKRRW